MEKLQELASPILQEPIVLAIFLGFLVYAGIRDYQTKLIRDKFNLLFFGTAVGLMVLTSVSHWLDFPFPDLLFGWQNIVGMILGFLFLFIPAFVKNQPMGGDIKISAVVGFWLGYEAMMIVLLLATLLNILYWLGAFYVWKEYGSKTLMPFAPFIALGAVLFYSVTYFV